MAIGIDYDEAIWHAGILSPVASTNTEALLIVNLDLAELSEFKWIPTIHAGGAADEFIKVSLIFTDKWC